jgi:glycosidase
MFLLIGENWWKEWPDTLMDAEPWVKGDIFDAVMHYQWYKPARYLFLTGNHKISVSEFNYKMDSLWTKYRPSTCSAMMNLMASHDSPRFWTSIGNSNKYKFHCKPGEDPNYYLGPPSDETIQRGKALLIHQFTMIGAPHIYNGDEMGMYGSDDPDNRKPLLWEDITFDVETSSPLSAKYYEVVPKANDALRRFYKDLIQMRTDHKVLRNGDFKSIQSGNDEILAYERTNEDSGVSVYINTSNQRQELSLENGTPIFIHNAKSEDGVVIFEAYGAIVLMN